MSTLSLGRRALWLKIPYGSLCLPAVPRWLSIKPGPRRFRPKHSLKHASPTMRCLRLSVCVTEQQWTDCPLPATATRAVSLCT